MEYELAIPAIKFTVETKCAVAPVNPTDLVRLSDLPGGAVIEGSEAGGWRDINLDPLDPVTNATIYYSFAGGNLVTISQMTTTANIQVVEANSVNYHDHLGVLYALPVAYRPSAAYSKIILMQQFGVGEFSARLTVAPTGEIFLSTWIDDLPLPPGWVVVYPWSITYRV